MKNKKKILSITVDNVSPRDLDGTLVDLRNKVQEWIDEYGPTAKLDWDPHFFHDYDQNPSPRYNIITYREETDLEFNYRLGTEKTHRDMSEERERLELERLQKKYKK